jgi:acyl-CoA dehydrogenase
MASELNPRAGLHADIRAAVRELCREFGNAYWQRLDAAAEYPEAFVAALTRAGWLAALIPEAYGGGGLSLEEASVILEEINRSGANSGACHAQMYTMGTLLRHGTEAQKQRWLPPLARGELRLQSFAVTEPAAGTDTASIRTFAQREGGQYLISGQKVWTSRLAHTDLMLLLARTTPADEVEKRGDGLSVFLLELPAPGERAAAGMSARPIRNMVHHETSEVFFDRFAVPAENLIGAEGQGLRCILDGMNAERILIAAECIGDGFWFLDRARAYAGERVVFGRPIGQNQGVQFPLARAYANLLAADLMRYDAAARFDHRQPAGPAANMAKLLAAEASWECANVCLQTHGGFAFAAEFDIERKFRETRLYQVAPVSTNLILAYLGEHVLGLPRSY